MLAWVYDVVTLLCLINFRSVKITACIIVPLMLISVLGQAFMTFIGIGVNYSIYIYSALQRYLDQNLGLHEAYFET